jgi:hypothetical protein
MTDRHVDPDAVLGELKDFQRRTAVWAFNRLFDNEDPTQRFLVADEVGLGKTHIAKGVIAQVIDHLQRSGDERHDIVYVCSNGAIARQNLRKLVPKGIEPLEDVERLTMLPLAQLNQGGGGRSGVNLLAITPGTSLKFGHNTGRFSERCLAYAFLRAHWGAGVMSARARWIFWEGVSPDDGDERLRAREARYRKTIKGSLADFAHQMDEADRMRSAHHQPSVREMFETLVGGLAWKRAFPDHLRALRSELIGEIRRIMAIVGISALRPDLVVLDEFQRFKDLLDPAPANFASELANRLFNYVEPDTGRPTKTLLLSATPYRMFTTTDEPDADHYADFLSTCSFLFSGDEPRVRHLRDRFGALRGALTSADGLAHAETICADIASALRNVMARTERLAATPDRDGMLCERDALVTVEPDDLRAYMRVGDLAEAVDHHEPTEYWKAGPYLVNFMERYKLKEALDQAAADGTLPQRERLGPGPGLLDWEDVEAYEAVDPQNGRLRWLLDDLKRHRAFELLWMPPSLRYYDTGSVYDSAEATAFTKRLIFSGWAVVPKVVSALTSFESERQAYATRKQNYTAEYRQRGGQRLTFRTAERGGAEPRPGESHADRRAAAMTAFLLVWPSVTLADLGNPRNASSDARTSSTALLSAIEARVADIIEPLTADAPREGVVDQRWYWAAPLLLDRISHRLLLGREGATAWEGDGPGAGFLAHLGEARAMAEAGASALGRPPDDLVAVLAEVALGGPAQCALRAISAVTGLPPAADECVSSTARAASAFRNFFNAPEVTGIIADGRTGVDETDEIATARYWRDVIGHCIGGNLQAVLDEHAHVLRDWLGYINLVEHDRRAEAARHIAGRLAEALDVRTSVFRVDVPRPADSDGSVELDQHRMRTRFAVAFGNQSLDEGGEARVDAVSAAFNSPFWPFVLTSTSVGQEGLDFHLWCHAVVHWNLPANPVDLEQREGRVHRYKGHAVRRNVAATVGSAMLADGLPATVDPWDELFSRAAVHAQDTGDEMVPYWVFHQGPARIERHVPVLPFSRDAVTLPRLRKTLAAYRLAFGQPRQEELIEFLGADRTDSELLLLASRLRIDLSPPR